MCGSGLQGWLGARGRTTLFHFGMIHDRARSLLYQTFDSKLLLDRIVLSVEVHAPKGRGSCASPWIELSNISPQSKLSHRHRSLRSINETRTVMVEQSKAVSLKMYFEACKWLRLFASAYSLELEEPAMAATVLRVSGPLTVSLTLWLRLLIPDISERN